MVEVNLFCEEKMEFLGVDRVEYNPHIRSVSFQEIKETSDVTVIYFGGTFEPANAKSTEELKQSLADYSGKKLFSFSAESDTKKVANFVETIPGKKILVGYSQGANKILDLGEELKTRKNDSVDGYIFLEPTAFYQQKRLTLTFLNEGLKTAAGVLGQIGKETIGGGIKRKREETSLKKGAYLLGEVLSDGIPKFFDIKGKYNLREQIKNMSKIHPGIEEVEESVVIVQGKNDKVTDYTRNNPEMFKKSKNVVRILAERHGSHGLPVMRSEQVAKVAIGLLNRNRKGDLKSAEK